MFNKRAEYIANSMGSRLWERALADDTLPLNSVCGTAYKTLVKEALKVRDALGESCPQYEAVRQSMIELVLTHLSKGDPTPNFQYLQWIAVRWSKNDFRAEDVLRIKDELQTFDKFKPRLRKDGHPVDINQYKSAGDVFTLIRQYVAEDIAHSAKEEERRKEQAFFDKHEATLIHNDDTIKVIIPRTQDASSHFGRGTRWCTTGTYSRGMFDHYSKSGPLYIIMTSKGKFQFHFPTQQFMNQLDQHVDIGNLVKQFPSLKKVFHKEAEKDLIFALMEHVSPEVWEKAFLRLCESKDAWRTRPIGGFRNPGEMFRSIPVEDQTLNMALALVDVSVKFALQHTNQALQQHPEFQKRIICKRPEMLQAMDPSQQTPSLVELVIQKSPLMLRHVRKDLLVEPLLITAVSKDPVALGQIPQPKQTLNVIGAALKATSNRITQRSIINMVHDKRLRAKLIEAHRQTA